jgi:hypothetical protein
MSAVGSIDWTFLEAFFGEYGKIITALIALLVALISLVIATLKSPKICHPQAPRGGPQGA